MIDFFNSRFAKCKACSKAFEYDISLVKRAPSVCPGCKDAARAKREAARRKVVKTQAAATDCSALERLAVRTHKEVGELMGISAEMVRKVELAAIEKLRRNFAHIGKELFE